MGTAKRERQKQGRQQRIAEAQQAAQRKKRNRTVRNGAILVVGLIVLLFVLSRFQKSDNKTTTSTSSSTAPASSTQGVVIPPKGASITGDTPCPPADGTAQRTTTFAKAPPTCLDPAKSYSATLHTSMGDVTIGLDSQTAPVTVNNFVVLSRYHFYDGVAFHRVIPGFVDQGGDATGPTPGQGGPGYTIPDELPKDPSVYTEGAVAMANSGPNTGGSQFFIVIGSGGQQLTANYAKFGTVIAGLDVAQKINQAGSTSGTPTTVVTIESVTINES